MRKLLLVDLSNAVYKAAATHPTLNCDGVFTGGLYGFMKAIIKAVNACGATSILICADTKPYHRSLLYPEYKAMRVQIAAEKMNTQDWEDSSLTEKVHFTISQIMELAKVTGWPVWSVPGFEADDLIAHAVMHNRHRYDAVIAMSNDSDLYQLFSYKNFSIYKGKKGAYTHADYYAEWELPPHELYLALAMTGTHNEVEGIRGIGPATAKKLLLYDGVGYETLRMQHRELLERNEVLIRLPHPDFPINEKIPSYTSTFNERALMSFCAMYDIKLERWMSESFEQLNGL